MRKLREKGRRIGALNAYSSARTTAEFAQLGEFSGIHLRGYSSEVMTLPPAASTFETAVSVALATLMVTLEEISPDPRSLV